MLDQHPNVNMSQTKETNFFVHAFEPTAHFVDHRGTRVFASQNESDICDTLEKYGREFANTNTGQIAGEASPWYLINDEVPARIRAHRNSIKILIILRNPSDVAFANFIHQVRVGAESLDLEQVEQLFEHGRYTKPNLYPFCHHLRLPQYSIHLPAWVTAFDESNLHIMIYEEFNIDRRAAVSGVFDFLRLHDDVKIDVDTSVNVSGLPKSTTARDLLQGSVAFKKFVGLVVPTKPRRKVRALLEAINTTKKVTMPGDIRSRFDHLFQDDINYVEQLLGREIPAWRELRSKVGDATPPLAVSRES